MATISWRPHTGNKYRLDGKAVLEELLRRAGYPTPVHAAAAYALFHHPDTVSQTKGLPLFPVIRCKEMKERGTYVQRDGRMVMLDDNYPPTYAFSVPACVRGCDDVQFNHLWPLSSDWRYYTALWNVCPTPAFLAKLTDSNPAVQEALRYRAFDLFGYLPDGHSSPSKPSDYEQLPWSEPLPSVKDLEAAFRNRLRSENNRVSRCAQECGWMFSGFKPEAAA